MAVVCIRSKFGFCKFDRNCVNIHYTEVCYDTHCRGGECEKRHPVVCSFFRNYGRCKFGNYCAYRHPLSKEHKLDNEVKTLKSELNEVKQKLEIMTAKIEKLDKTDKTAESVVQEKVVVTTAEKMDDEVPQEQQEKTLCDIIRENSDQYKTTDSEIKVWKCEICDSGFNKENDLKVHKADTLTTETCIDRTIEYENF